MSNFWLAKNLGLKIFPVLNKIDIDPTLADEVELSIQKIF